MIAACLRELIGPIYQGICTEWEHPENVLSYCTAEGGWLGATVYSSYDMDWYISEEAEINNEQIVSDIIAEISDYQWCKDPGDDVFSESMTLSWNYFSYLVKHSFRYTFFQIDEQIYLHDDPLGEEMRITPKNFLIVLNKIVKNNKRMISSLKKGTKIYRARLFKDKESILYNVDELGAPPKGKAVASRMSPSGIPLFYCALDKKTAIEEVLVRKNNYKYAVISEFEILANIDVVNFCTSPNFVSVFDPDKIWERKANNFLNQFSIEIGKDVVLDDRIHTEYVPTQIITEYFRYIFKHKKNKSLSGILYPSAREDNGKNCALFINSTNCQGASNADEKKLVVKMTDTECINL